MLHSTHTCFLVLLVFVKLGKTETEEAGGNSQKKYKEDGFKQIVSLSREQGEIKTAVERINYARDDEIGALKEENILLKKRLAKLESQMASLDGFLRRSNKDEARQLAYNTFIGFSVAATQDSEVPGKIEFDREISNFGNGYDQEENQFVCPVSGVYYFHVSASSSRPFHANFAIMKEYEQLVNTIAMSSEGAVSSGSAAVVVECQEGETVYVACLSGAPCTYMGASYTAFSGMLLHTL